MKNLLDFYSLLFALLVKFGIQNLFLSMDKKYRTTLAKYFSLVYLAHRNGLSDDNNESQLNLLRTRMKEEGFPRLLLDLIESTAKNI
ncbi:hypothetical protein A2533_04660 [Candidatus Falkowbacteria bacterium RIFOXYD2_FULL_35_9]|uniref:Uncharacterized protein n=1 Tax=Candidatus Falkowbacteria bacterium RIFOXYC2_FULL_36_12 TaxID=1798002 RepID=A0A1F5T323_9BACT|nr:MAG: hypothetical protein A2478_01635 [Candidatus Falkowbacteria bacterium RIFOXYC2_FULL_36_12]OGF33955.1 MAG: hypothetical protein A2223_03335 [Candidatus Falkowbacteria bacterium RIFOXYA2_FULL_35_8]OGF46065.1 MAG: hypothetical protein A2533_04660 [Candidatus Falkowbacteria bacterium RIFOXYD2_FULL_35_9]